MELFLSRESFGQNEGKAAKAVMYTNHVSFCRFKQLKIETTRLEKKSVKKSEEISRKKLGTV